MKSPINNTRLFTGREYDREVSLYFNRARYYDPQIGRFISRDPIGQNDQVNLYTYVANSPLVYVDRTGTVKIVLQETGERLLGWAAQALLLALSPETANAPGDKTYAEDMERGRLMDEEVLNPSGGALAMSMILPMPGGKKRTLENAGEEFFKGAKYTDDVIKKGINDVYHGFSPAVEKFAEKYGVVTVSKGGDGEIYQFLKMPGGLGGREGVFEFIKDSTNQITHRFFRPN